MKKNRIKSIENSTLFKKSYKILCKNTSHEQLRAVKKDRHTAYCNNWSI